MASGPGEEPREVLGVELVENVVGAHGVGAGHEPGKVDSRRDQSQRSKLEKSSPLAATTVPKCQNEARQQES